ncbi:short-chain dehydrogenase [Herbaspirillum rubrisubalbicans]|uniref:Short-chain dehydrogenase n=2 Tax=Herbaspirillum TaxID=963 RepID=A0ABX9C7P9_9BURK|nr:SDR family oxidoreductase [Herbaspirillum rubrisubalbicans]NQE47084.1 short-chain dehydrogenase [Herbaspirillum rubrisubalbicans]RAM66960.1 short-chain dehydrogenase [Herbaspirillum rubrisubalbicans]RAN49175.1 short-chain dehydrogenase [Herbaspirillum rubrisubalbicans]
MRCQLKNITDQTIVITGATSGIGLATARLAAARGARLVLVARDTQALERVASELDASGQRVLCVTADVADFSALQDAAARAVERFGQIDTWINNAGVSIFGRHAEVSLEDHRRLFETNYWGVVNGSLAALPHLKANTQGAALINLGSELSDVAVPLQGAYSASKHAVKGFTDSLRVELAEEGAPISVTLVKPAAIDTPFTRHAKNYMEVQPKLPPPVYAPNIAAEAILVAAQSPRRDLYVGAASRLVSSANKCAPAAMDYYLKTCMFSQQRSDRPATSGTDRLYANGPQVAVAERGGEKHVMPFSPYTWASAQAPMLSRLAVLGVACLVAGRIAGRKGT